MLKLCLACLVLAFMILGPEALAQKEEAVKSATPAAAKDLDSADKGASPAATPSEDKDDKASPTAPEREENSEASSKEDETKDSKSIEDLYAPDLPKKGADPKDNPDAVGEAATKEPYIYVSDTDNGRIAVMQGISGKNFTSVGMPGYGMGRFLRPAQIWMDYSYQLYVADSGNNRVIRIDQGSNDSWNEINGLSEPQGVAVDASGVYVSDTKADRVLVYDKLTNDAKPRDTLSHPLLKRPGALWIDTAGALYICSGEDPPGGRLFKTWLEKGIAEKKGAEAKQQRRWAVFKGEGLSGSRFLPSAVVTGKSGICMLDSSGQRLICMQDISGHKLQEYKLRIDPRFRLSRPIGMAVDKEGYIYITDSGNDRILKLNFEGNVLGEFHIADSDPSTMLANPSSIFIYTPAPIPEPTQEDDVKGKQKNKTNRKTVKDNEVKIQSEW